jgi:hypothetical protein
MGISIGFSIGPVRVSHRVGGRRRYRSGSSETPAEKLRRQRAHEQRQALLARLAQYEAEYDAASPEERAAMQAKQGRENRRDLIAGGSIVGALLAIVVGWIVYANVTNHPTADCSSAQVDTITTYRIAQTKAALDANAMDPDVPGVPLCILPDGSTWRP